ncbi:MAG TPA: DNA alkylation repair protein [Thermoanaerobaculia bacterium]|jgi:3-methyladenine DNA glycosylase AlkD|nr:DNA alkylation repair protein [Thermoanaerobaculia bacterium]
MTLTADVRRALEAAADPTRAPGMQAYMKSGMPYLGVSADAMRRVAKTVFAEHPLESAGQWREDVLAIWRGARFREERYVAVELTGDRRAREWQTLEALPMYEELIVTGAWWDYVDVIAAQRIGELLRRDKKMKGILRRWAQDADIWKRRAAILAQLEFKKETDEELLYDCIAPSIGSKEFFLRKGIGWALRQYARTDPDAVRRYVREHEDQLSGLTRREALKHL